MTITPEQEQAIRDKLAEMPELSVGLTPLQDSKAFNARSRENAKSISIESTRRGCGHPLTVITSSGKSTPAY